MELVELAQYGVVGICIALIALVVLLINKIFKFMENHINHNTEAIKSSAEVQIRLTEKIKQDIEIGKETHSLLRNFNNKGRK